MKKDLSSNMTFTGDKNKVKKIRHAAIEGKGKRE